MQRKAKEILFYSTLLVLFLYFLFWGLVSAKAFLAPLAVAAILAMVVLPVARWFERKGVKRGWAALWSDLLILSFFLVLAGVLSFEVKSFMEDWPKIKQQLEPKLVQVQEFVKEKTGMPIEEQRKKISQQMPGESSMSGGGQGGISGANQQQSQQQPQKQQQQGQDQSTPAAQREQQNQGLSGGQAQAAGQSQRSSQSQQSGGGMLATAGSFIMKFFGFLGTSLLTLVYIFFFLLYRSKFRKSVVRTVPEEKQEKTHEVMSSAVKVSQNYLAGKLILCVIIAVFYAIGLSLSGIKHAILVAVLASVLTLIPYLGNIIGFGLALGMAFFSGGSSTAIIGVCLTFGITQFLETYTLEPYVVGDKVDLDPTFTIIVVVLGNAVWGVIGMLIAIPALGIAKVIFDHVSALKPLGYMIGQEGIGEGKEKGGMLSRMKQWALNKASS